MNTLVLKPQSTAHLKGTLLSASKALEEEQHLSLQENFRQLLLMELLLARGELSHEQIGSRNNDDIYLQIDPKLTKQNPERRKLANLHPSIIADIALMRQGRPCMKLIVTPAHASILKFWLSGAERCAATESRLVDMMEQLARIESNMNSPKIEEVEERTKPADPEETAKKKADSLQSIQDAVIDISNNVADLRYPEQAALRQQKADEATDTDYKNLGLGSTGTFTFTNRGGDDDFAKVIAECGYLMHVDENSDEIEILTNQKTPAKRKSLGFFEVLWSQSAVRTNLATSNQRLIAPFFSTPFSSLFLLPCLRFSLLPSSFSFPCSVPLRLQVPLLTFDLIIAH